MRQNEIKNRVLEEARFFIDKNSTVRATAEAFSIYGQSITKSTVHKDLTERLPTISPLLYDRVYEILQKNKAERHLRGGEATRKKYLNKH